MKGSNVIRFPIERVEVRRAIEALFTVPEYLKPGYQPLTREMYLALAYPEGVPDPLPAELEAAPEGRQ